jgi:hypothetical protein
MGDSGMGGGGRGNVAVEAAVEALVEFRGATRAVALGLMKTKKKLKTKKEDTKETKAGEKMGEGGVSRVYAVSGEEARVLAGEAGETLLKACDTLRDEELPRDLGTTPGGVNRLFIGVNGLCERRGATEGSRYVNFV